MNGKHTGNPQDTREYFEKMKEKMKQKDNLIQEAEGFATGTVIGRGNYAMDLVSRLISRITSLETIISERDAGIVELETECQKAEAASINAEVKIAKLMARVAELEERCFNETF